MSFALAPAAILAILASLPRAKADEVCETDVFGKEHCRRGENDRNIRVIIGLTLIGLGLIFIVVFAILKRRRQRQAEAAVIASGPIMAYAPQGQQQGWQGQSLGATIPSTYDPNAPPQAYPFNGYGQNVGGPIAGGPMNPPYPAPIYAPPAAPMKESV